MNNREYKACDIKSILKRYYKNREKFFQQRRDKNHVLKFGKKVESLRRKAKLKDKQT